MKFCKLEKCKIKDIYIKEHCFYGYREPECWRGWLDAIIFIAKFRRETKEWKQVRK